MPFLRDPEQLMARGRLPLLAAVMGAAFMIAGVTMMARLPAMQDRFEIWRLPQGLLFPVGLVILVGALCLPIARTRALGAAMLGTLAALALFLSRTTPLTLNFLALAGMFMLLVLVAAAQPRRRFLRGPVR